MKHIICALLGISLLASAVQTSQATDAVWNYTVEASATVQASPPQITLSWPQDSNGTPDGYTIYRKAPADTSWGNPIANISGSQLSYTDTSVSVGTIYDYEIVKNFSSLGYNGYGYLQSAVNGPLVENRGKVILIVDNTYAAQLTNELARLQQDLVGDGWTVIRHDVNRNDSVVSVKNLIKADYNADPANVKSVFLFGHVPVPQSGEMNPDGHPEHIGAWSADSFYGVMNDSGFTDYSVNFAQTGNTDPADAARLSNYPNDGKYDQVQIPGNVDLEVGRVDLADMPGQVTWGGPATFPSELDLLRNYLNKDHNYRVKTMTARRRAFVGDYFGARSGEAFAASGYRNGAAFFGASNVDSCNLMFNDQQGTWVPYLAQHDYLFAYGCGAGSYTTIAGLGNAGNYNATSTPEIVQNDIRAVFVNFFGSWLGDFAHSDDIMRAVLATPTYGLACAWSGRPHWFMFPMALGETIGYTAKLTQNNNGLYQNQINSAANEVHIALMGDPTLRLHQMFPPTSLNGTMSGSSMNLTWSPSADATLGYYVYRSANAAGPFTRISSSLVTGTSYTDNNAPSGSYYMVRAIKLETSASGTYTNASEGAFWPTTGNFVSTNSTSGSGTTTNSSSGSTGSTGGSTTSTNSTSGSTTGSGTTTTNGSSVWVDDALPAGAGGASDGGDSWNWISSNPTPYSGQYAHQSALASGLHEHYFNWATATLAVNTGDTLSTWVYLDPANPPAEILLGWNDSTGSWEHRAYWGANNINYGTAGTSSRYYAGALPATGGWVQLTVPASAVGLEGTTLQGMDFALYGGKATFDYSGIAAQNSSTNSGSSSGSTNSNSTTTVSISANPSQAVIGGTNDAVLTFARTGDTGSALTVNYNLGGTAVKWSDYRTMNGDMPVSVTIPAGAASATMTIVGMTNTLNANPETATFTLTTNSTYAIASANVTTVTILPSGTIVTNTSSGGTTTTNSGSGSGITSTNTTGSGSLTNSTGSGTITNSTGSGSITNSTGGGSTTNSVGPTTNSVSTVSLSTNAIPGSGPADYLTLHTPKIGDTTLHVLSPTLLELHLINALPQGASAPTNWNFVNNFNFTAPATGSFTVTANGQNVSVTGVGFKRRAISAPIAAYDLRMDSVLYLQLSSPIPDNATVQVTNPNGTLWGTNTLFTTTTDPLRYNPAIHVNQEGYEPAFPKKAIVGYYLGSLGEMPITATTFTLVDAKSGAQVFSGTLTQRKDVGYTYTPTPYQNVYEADFSSFTTPGQYRIEVPGMGASLPFVIQEGIAMDFARTYELGMFEQRSGYNVAMPYTRFTHAADHTAPANVVASASAYPFTWTTISNYAMQANSDNPAQTAPLLTDPSKQLYPFINQGPIDVSGGHFDAGDYSKYTWDMAQLIHVLVFSADSLPGVGQMDNLGIPESGDGISDVLQEAKWEADALAKMQDADGGFYYVCYPENSEYEGNVLPENGQPQVLWPKNTAATAAAVAALAQIASSPAFKAAYPQVASNYMAKALLGWQFLTNAIAKYGKTGAYQKMMHFGDDFTDQDDEAWAACELYLATGDPQFQTTLESWFPDPTSTSTFRWGWWKMFASYGNAVRDYAFAVKSGRLQPSQIDPAYLAKCINTITNCANDQLKFSQDNAYGSSFPDATKAVRGAGWYYSPEQAFDITVGYQFNPDPRYLDAMVRNLNYEGGCNPVNVTYVTGLGIKRQREVVDQYSANDRHVLSKSGIPIGNIQGGFVWTGTYGSALEAMDFPSDDATTAPYPYYDRWGDSWNVTTEASTDDTVKNFATAAALAGMTSLKTQAWTYANAQITTSGTPSQGQPLTATLNVPGMDLTGARIVWEAQGAEPSYGSSFTFTPTNYGSAWIEAEANWPDGRRVFAVTNFFAENSLPTVSVNASVPDAQIGTTNYGIFTFTTASPVTNAITVNFTFSGSAVKWDDYRTPAGNMPQTVVIAPGTSSTNLVIEAIGNETAANPETILLTLNADPSYNLSSQYFTTMTVTTNYIATTNSTGGGTTTNSTGGGSTTNSTGGGSTTNSTGGSSTNSTTLTYTNMAWVDDALPTGASGMSDGGDTWNWVTTGPAPYSGKLAHQSTLAAGLHEHYFNYANQTLAVNTGDKVFAYVYLDPTNPPSEIMLGWNDSTGSWEHRAYWGTNAINYGSNGTSSRYYAGALPATGGWVRLEVPASAVGLEGMTLQGMDYALYNGRATFDYAGKSALGTTNSTSSGGTNSSGGSTNTVTSWTSQQMLAASVHVNSLTKATGNGGMKLNWDATSNDIYAVAYKSNLTDTAWTTIATNLTGSAAMSWTDTSSTNVPQRFYIIYKTN